MNGRNLYRVPREVGVARGRLDLGVAEELRDQRQAFAEREGRNSRTGERIAIGPSSGVSFKAGKALKDALN